MPIQPRENGKSYWEPQSRERWTKDFTDPDFELDHLHGRAERALYWAWLDLQVAEQRLNALADSNDMLKALRVARVFAENELECRERSYLPDGDDPYLKEAQEAVKVIRTAIAKAEGRAS